MPVRIIRRREVAAAPERGRASAAHTNPGPSLAKEVAQHEILITTFPDVTASSKEECVVTLDELLEYVANAGTYPTKGSCPLIKLAKFGNKKTARNSLRHDANVAEIYGIEGDYDGEQMSMEAAATLLEGAGVNAVLYSSPSHTPTKPRWRVLAPTSKPFPPNHRHPLVARLNGILGGVLARESFALSQSYFVGRVAGVVYETQVVNGKKFVDQVDVARERPKETVRNAAVGAAQGDDDEGLRTIIHTGSSGVHNALCSLAARFVGRGMGAVDVEATLTGLMNSATWNPAQPERWADRFAEIPSLTASAVKKFRTKLKVVPPLGDEDLRPSAFQGPSAEYAKIVDRTDTGNVNRLVQLTSGYVRYIVETREWMVWRHGQWRIDPHGGVLREATLLVAEHYRKVAAHYDHEAKYATDDKERKALQDAARSARAWEKQCRDRRRIDALCALAAKDPRLQISVTALDQSPDLLGVQNGVVDLRTGLLRDAAREDLVTKLCAVNFDPKANAPTWERAIGEITGMPKPVGRLKNRKVDPATVGKYAVRPDLAQYLQRALGYCLTGRTSEHKLFVCYGPGSNGKNVILDVLQRILTGNCVAIPPDALMATRHDADAERPTSIAASLAGARIAVSSESKDGQKLDAGVVKRHTGGGYMNARRMRENVFTFLITHKLWLMTNHLPRLDHLDPALRGRLHIIPFDRRWNRPGEVSFDPALPDGDKDLPEKLNAELTGILAWLVRGAVEYIKHGLPPPPSVMSTTKSYFEEQNPLPRWISTLVRVHAPASGTKASELLDAFRDWCTANEERFEGITQKQLSAALTEAGVASKQTNKGVFYAVRVPAEMILGSGI